MGHAFVKANSTLKFYPGTKQEFFNVASEIRQLQVVDKWIDAAIETVNRETQKNDLGYSSVVFL